MDVRCARCRAVVSEWAARCPECGEPLDVGERAKEQPQRDQEEPAEPQPPATAPGRARSAWPLIGVAAVVAFAVAVTVAVADPRPGQRAGGVPSQLRARLLFFADPDGTRIVRADGKVMQTFRQLAGQSARPVVTPDGLAVFVHDGEAYAVRTSAPWSVDRVGAADRLFPADGGDVGLEVGPGSGGASFVEYAAADGTVPQPGTTRTQLTVPSTAVAKLPSGLLVESAAGLQLLRGTTTATIGDGEVVGVSYTTVAWLDHGRCQRNAINCPLHITDTASGTDRVIAPVPGFSGFAGGRSE